MGDFHILSDSHTFDLVDDYDSEGNQIYRHSYYMVVFMWFLFIISVFYLFMIFMNFIIAVIADSYNIVTQNKESHDLQQRVEMIDERELHFSEQ
jgi:uncharacterized iron-regulated membrane protein